LEQPEIVKKIFVCFLSFIRKYLIDLLGLDKSIIIFQVFI